MIRVLNVCLPVKAPIDTMHGYAIDRLINRINRTMEAKDSHALLILDEGKEQQITRQLRRMAVFNPISSRFGVWADGG